MSALTQISEIVAMNLQAYFPSPAGIPIGRGFIRGARGEGSFTRERFTLTRPSGTLSQRERRVAIWGAAL